MIYWDLYRWNALLVITHEETQPTHVVRNC